MTQLKFGDCLHELLRLRGWSASRLAKVLDIDSSYVRRWIRGERTPALNTSYTKLIVDNLNDGLDKDYKKAAKAAYLKGMEALAGELDNHVSTYERMYNLLRESQVYSLSLDFDSRKTHKPSEGQSRVAGLLQHAQRQLKPAFDEGHVEETVLDNNEDREIPKVIHGREKLLLAAISLINGLVQDKEFKGDREIFLTFQSEKDYFAGYPELYAQWKSLIIKALRAGCNIRQLCKLNKNLERSLNLVNQIMDWSNYKGAYTLYYFNKYGINNPPFEIILAKGKGVLLCFAADNYNEIDTALYLNDHESVQAMESFAKQMFVDVEPMVRSLGGEEYFELNSSKDRKQGNHLLCNHDLNFLTVPEETMKKYIGISIPDEAENSIHMKRIEDSQRSFYRDIEQYKMHHIYPMRVFEHLVRTGTHTRNVYFRPERSDIVNHINHIVSLLRRYEGFEIALVSDNQMELLNQAGWEIKGDHTIMVGVMPKDESDPKMEMLMITEGTIVGAFQEYFWNTWERINPLNRDKASVIHWLEQLLKSHPINLSI